MTSTHMHLDLALLRITTKLSSLIDTYTAITMKLFVQSNYQSVRRVAS
jgi:hypothetical protein